MSGVDPTDSAGVPWQGRSLPTGGFEGDDGAADAGLMRALTCLLYTSDAADDCSIV